MSMMKRATRSRRSYRQLIRQAKATQEARALLVTVVTAVPAPKLALAQLSFAVQVKPQSRLSLRCSGRPLSLSGTFA